MDERMHDAMRGTPCVYLVHGCVAVDSIDALKSMTASPYSYFFLNDLYMPLRWGSRNAALPSWVDDRLLAKSNIRKACRTGFGLLPAVEFQRKPRQTGWRLRVSSAKTGHPPERWHA